jgi:twitching motility protein PilU
VLADLVMERRGLILIVGSTGSGKSTTLASMLDHRNGNCTGHILTIEDPIEYLFKHKKSLVNQREIGMDTLGWENALKNAMRQAPDCILIGEIRDKETMQAAIAYAQTGHLCLGTLHANNSYHALNRIINFFPLDSRGALYMDLSVSLKAIVSQRLVKKKDGKLTPAVEVLLNSYHVQELIERGDIPALKEAMEQSLAPGSQTFEQDLVPALSQRRDHAAGSAAQCRLTDQPVLADQQLRSDRRIGKRRKAARSVSTSPAPTPAARRTRSLRSALTKPRAQYPGSTRWQK